MSTQVRVQFIKGPVANYSTEKYTGAIYFATDEKKIYVDGVAYGGDIDTTRIVSGVTWNEGKLYVQYLDGTMTAMDPEIPVVTTTTAGLMSAEDKVKLDGVKDAVDAIGFSIKKLAVAEGDSVASYQLVGKDGTTVFGDTINIPKDLVVSSGTVKTVTAEGIPYAEAKIGDVYIELVLSNSETPLYIPANKLVDEYTTGDYISIVDRVISVDYESVKAQIKTDLVDSVDNKVAAIEVKLSGEDGLEKVVAANNAAIKQIETNVGVLATNVTNFENRIGGVEQGVLTNSNAVLSLNEKVTELEKALNAEEEGSVIQQITNITNVVADIKVKDVNTVANNGVALTLDENGVIGVVSNVNTNDIKTTAVIGTMPAASTVQSVLENLDARIQAAVSGGVTAIGAGFGISVDSSDVNNPSVALKIKEGSALSVDADGLDIYWTTIN